MVLDNKKPSKEGFLSLVITSIFYENEANEITNKGRIVKSMQLREL